MSLHAIPCSREQAHAWVAEHHRHHKPPPGEIFRIGACDNDGAIHGVIIVGRPVARKSDDGRTLEVTRLATDGHKNACSFLYGHARRAAWALGYTRILTFTLPVEGGASLKASGWIADGCTPGRSWSVPTRAREDKHPLGMKLRWISANQKACPTIPVWPEIILDQPQQRLFG